MYNRFFFGYKSSWQSSGKMKNNYKFYIKLKKLNKIKINDCIKLFFKSSVKNANKIRYII